MSACMVSLLIWVQSLGQCFSELLFLQHENILPTYRYITTAPTSPDIQVRDARLNVPAAIGRKFRIGDVVQEQPGWKKTENAKWND